MNHEPPMVGATFRSKSTYDREFMNKTGGFSQPIKKLDNLKCSKEWFGKSSYR